MEINNIDILFQHFHDWVVTNRKEGNTWDHIQNLCVDPLQSEREFLRLRAENHLPDAIRLCDWIEYIQAEKRSDYSKVLIAIFDQNPNSRALLKEYLIRYGMLRETDPERIWFEDSQAAEKLKKYAVGFHVALISLNDENAQQIGTNLYGINPDCLICYYKSENCSLTPFLHSRPYEFYVWSEGEDVFQKKLNEMLFRAVSAAGTFRYETKKILYNYPAKNILYFQSNLKYVYIKTVLGNDANIYAKLSDIERALQLEPCAADFIRIHKSFIVNQRLVQSMNKQTHTIELLTGEELPVSDAHYQTVLKMLKNRQR